MPLVSIITVCRNEIAKIQRTADSVRAQTFRDFEWIVKDGGSTDGTVDLLQTYRAEMRHFISAPDDGIFAAMNEAAAMAEGKWLLFLNGGDALPGADVLQAMRPYLLEVDDAHILVGGDRKILPDGTLTDENWPPVQLGMDHFYLRTINHQAAFIGASVFRQWGPYRTDLVFADYDFFARCVLRGVPIKPVPVLTSLFDLSGLSAKLNGSAIMKQEWKRVRRMYPLTYRARRFMQRLCRKISKKY